MEYEIKETVKGKVLVDEKAEIKGCYHDSFTNKIYQSNGAEYVKSGQVNNVIATINHSISKDVPMVVIEKEARRLAEIEVEDRSFTNVAERNKAINMFIRGFEAAQEKGVYSESDLRKAFQAGWKSSVFGATPGADTYIESLNQKYIELEMCWDCPLKACIEQYPTCVLQDGVCKAKEVIKTTRNAGGQLIAYVKL